jgi:hypothetical protein
MTEENKHVCLHEADLSSMATTLKTVCDDVKEIKTFVVGTNGEGILRRLKGLTTQVKVQWWFIGGVYMGIIGMIFWVIRQ